MEITGQIPAIVLMVAGVTLILKGGFRAMGSTMTRGLFSEVWLPFTTGIGFVLVGRWLIQ